jgi:hypothetical protein
VQKIPANGAPSPFPAILTHPSWAAIWAVAISTIAIEARRLHDMMLLELFFYKGK